MTSGHARNGLIRLGDRPWLVLGGGGLKGLAHIGAWRALTEAGIQLRGVVGTSIGALLALHFAAGRPWEELAEEARILRRSDIVRINRRVVWVNGIRQRSVFRGDVLRSYLARQIPAESWVALSMPCQINAVSLRTGDCVWFGTHAPDEVSMLDAVHASASLPVLYPPVRIGGEYYVDGGVADMLAVDRARDLGATGIVAIDAGSGGEEDPETVLAQGLVGVHQRVFRLMSSRRRGSKLGSWSGGPLALVRPPLDGFGTFDFEQIPYFIDAGYRATLAALE